MFFDVSIGRKNFISCLHPKIHFTLRGFRENSDEVTWVPQMLRV
jgi:hypothetical protein